jgi:hypothetical protein
MSTESIAHELWAAAQLAPGEGMEAGVKRIADILIQEQENPLYLLLLEKNSGKRELACDGNGKLVVAEEGNQKFLLYIGKKLLENGLLSGYQLLKTASTPHKKNNESNIHETTKSHL